MRATTLRGSRRILFLTAGALLVADQVTKAWARATLADRDLTVISGVLDLRLTENSGAAFGLFPGRGTLLGLAAVVAVAVIIAAAESAANRYETVALGLILGGALGNLSDRVWKGSGFLDGLVTDWIDLPNFPTFNLADSAITIGAALLLLGAVRRK